MLRDLLTCVAVVGVKTTFSPNFYIQEDHNSTFMPVFTEKGKRERTSLTSTV